MMIGEMMILKSEYNDYYKQTEQRLFSYNDLMAKKNNDNLDLIDLQKEGVTSKSKDILYRSVQGGIRLSPEELWQIKIENLNKQIADSTREISRLDDAIDAISDDYYSAIIKMRYLEGKNDEYIAEVLNCDVSTVRRNRKRIIKRIMIRLYGTVAMAI